jgi:serine/threonine-protein kinase RsbW
MTMFEPSIYSTSASVHELAGIRAFVFERLTSQGLDSNIAQSLCLAVDEACSNIILHGQHLNPSRLIIDVEYSNGLCRIRIKDNAKTFDPNSVKSPDMMSYFKNFSYGGLGIELMRRIVDGMIYEQADAKNQWNTLLLHKYIHSPRN